MRWLLIHGYTGSPEDLAPLARALDTIHGPGTATLVALHPCRQEGPAPGSTPVPAPAFDRDAFLTLLAAARPEGPCAVFGHSTGGSLALLALEALKPDLLVLAGTPFTVTGAQRAQLAQATRPGCLPPDLLDTAHMVRAIRDAARVEIPEDLPVLRLQGSEDALVPPEPAPAHPFRRNRLIHGAGHDLFHGPALSQVLEALWDLQQADPPMETRALARLRHLEPDVTVQAEAHPEGLRALLRSPGARRALEPGQPIPAGLGPLAPAPVLANVEVSSRCPHTCPACARAQMPIHRGDMDLAHFRELLVHLPYATRLTFVGLGEPTLHRDLPGLVAEARERRPALVTSGAVLDRTLARELKEAGLGSATFSLDAGTPELAAHLRPGPAFERTLEGFQAASDAFGDDIPRAVFTAVSVDNARHLDAVCDLARHFRARAWMLSDLNFAANASRSVAGAGTGEDRSALAASIQRALGLGLPVLDVKGLEELGKPLRLREWLLRPAERLWTRSPGHRACLSPWQTAAIAADGSLSACDCQPDVIVGNIFQRPFMELWNAPPMQRLREELLCGQLRPACRVCPRL